MKNWINKPLIILLVCISQLGCKHENLPIRLATYTYSTNNRIENLKPFSEDLQKQLARPVQIKSYPDVATFIEGIKSDEVDIGLINTLGYLLLSMDTFNMETIANLKVKENAKDNYKTVLLTTNENIFNEKDLRNHAKDISMMFVAQGSTSGNLVPRIYLSSIGIKSPEAKFKEVKYGGNHKSTLTKLIAGEADVCAIGSNEYYKQVKEDPSLLESTSLLWVSEEIPLGPVLLNNKISTKDKNKILDILLNMHEANSSALKSIKDGWSEAKHAEKFHSIDDSYYNHFRRVNGNETDLSNILEFFTKEQ